MSQPFLSGIHDTTKEGNALTKTDKNIARLKKEKLVSDLRALDSLVVAFSGGVDSTFLLALAHQALGQKVVAVTAKSAIHPDREIETAVRFALEMGIRHILFQSDEMEIPEFVSNAQDRCYYCKRHLFHMIFQIARDNNIRHVSHGENVDDLNDHRPGFRAAGEAGVIAPLMEATLTKDEIRLLSQEMGLPTWDKPALPCLATRIPYGVPITVEDLRMVETAEAFLLEQGFSDIRVRHHRSMARIEVNKENLKKFVDDGLRSIIVNTLRQIGFEHIALDLEGYVPGKTDRRLQKM